MSGVSAHYNNFLASHYTWMSGGRENKIAENLEFFDAWDISPKQKGQALDLGAGPGFGSIALSRRGFSVRAVDLCEKLLEEFRANAGNALVTIVHGDILEPENFGGHPVELVTLMGDTLTHLPSLESARELFKNIYNALSPNGKFLITYRDLSVERFGEQRFIPVQADADRILTCFLEYEPSRVNVYDLLYLRTPAGWLLSKSNYHKLRFSADEVERMLKTTGFAVVRREIVKGMTALMALRGK
ncbi:MAG: class I SAM-dependent methyltransferase [Nitrospinae bacterium]|nr:class I SAM-dependent methyltransferase [Nitrospinota bacterium]